MRRQQVRLGQNDPTNPCRFLKVSPDARAIAVIQQLSQTQTPCAVVVEDQRLIGLLTEQDVVRAIAAGTWREDAPVAAYMTQALATLTVEESKDFFLVSERFQQASVQYLPVVDESGQVLRVITPQSQLEQAQMTSQQLTRSLMESEQRCRVSEGKLNDILDSAIAAISSLRVFADFTWEYDYCSVGHESVFGYTCEELLNNPTQFIHRILQADLKSIIQPTLRAIVAEEITTATIEFRFLHKNGSLRWFSANFSARRSQGDIPPDCPPHWIVTIVSTDITAQKQAESRLRQLTQDLEQRVEQRTAVLRRVNEHLFSEMRERQQAEAALRSSEDRFQRIAANIPGVIYRYVMRSDGSEGFAYISPRCWDIFGLPAEVVMQDANALWDALHPDDVLNVRLSLRRAVYQRQPWSAEYRVQMPSGEIRWLRGSAQPQHQENGEVHWDGIALDISDRKRAESSLARLYQQVQHLNADLEDQVQERTAQLQQALEFESLLKRITDKMRDSLDETHILETAVRELAQVLSVQCCDAAIYNLEQHTSTITYEYAPALVPAQGVVIPMSIMSDIYAQLLKGQHLQFCKLEADRIRPDRTYVSILACPIADENGSLGDLWLFHESHYGYGAAEIRLVQQVANQCAIALRQARLYQAAQTQVAELERLNRLKDDFLSTISHELRTPMSSIKMAVHLLETALPTVALPGSTVDRYLQILKDECQREISLIDNLLDLTRLDAGTEPLLPSAIDLRIWLPHLSEPFLERTRRQRQQLIVEVSPDVPLLYTDLSCLERVLTELLNNACKYTPDGEAIVLSAFQPAPTPQNLLICVRNFGVEIPLSEHDRIFDKFYRIPSHDPWRHGGTGLGLALVKKLAQHMGATIQLETGPGTTFSLCFAIGFQE